MKIDRPINSEILTPKPRKTGFVVGNWEDPDCYACIPYGNQLMVIHKGSQLKVCRNDESAINFIKKHKKRRKK